MKEQKDKKIKVTLSIDEYTYSILKEFCRLTGSEMSNEVELMIIHKFGIIGRLKAGLMLKATMNMLKQDKKR